MTLEPSFEDKRPGRRTSAFVVDPKNELLEYITTMCRARNDMKVRKIVMSGGQKSALRVNFDTLLATEGNSDVQGKELLNNPHRFESLATSIVERAASLDTQSMMNVSAEQSGDMFGIVVEARAALEVFVESLIWFRRHWEVSSPKWEEISREPEGPEQIEQEIRSGLKEDVRDSRYRERVTQSVDVRKDWVMHRNDEILGDDELSRLIIEADYCCQAKDMAIEFSNASSRMQSKQQRAKKAVRKI